MLNDKGFDLWADDYDVSVNLSDENNEYPFAGYKDLLNEIYNVVMAKSYSKVLDIGLGTGILSKKLYDNNHIITGIDFSAEMLKISQQKMHKAKLIKHNFADGLTKELNEDKFDFIISTYAMHHLTDAEKAQFLNSLRNNLSDDGVILIGDVSFETTDKFTSCKAQFNQYWDNDEFYFVYDKLIDLMDYKSKSYKQISICAGIMTLSTK